ncbi:hypothetical protein BDN71DRAFT_1441418 [Pleurotus eryngii]|uniref:U three protein 23 n=1 Tax=Pleurotus eryngii TaxID=5323 RepID=A0A9P6DAY4_PLEER|nr:hypothetical protein BDN71DRAFT_1441418 [Pleurotus eryngii]
MRHKRAKTYKRLMALYSMSFGFRQPYQVLIDSHMCKEAIDHKLDIMKQLGVVLQGLVKPMITQCCIHELYLQGKSQQPAVDLAKSFERRKCNHREAIPGHECLTSVIGDKNKHRYVVASQSQPLRAALRQVPGVPLIHINRIVMVLEPPSDATIDAKKAMELQSVQPTLVPDIALVQSSSKQPQSEPPRRKQGPKGPNPLSMKKRKAAPTKLVPKRDLDGGALGKGKQRSTTNAGAVNGSDGEQHRGVEKRKRPSDSIDSNEDGPDVRSSNGRKRKRRRKSPAVDTPDGRVE